MTESLRERCIEAGANAIANDRAEEIEVWHFADAEIALDAILDVLEESTEEWLGERWPNATNEMLVAALNVTEDLLFVLRGNGE